MRLGLGLVLGGRRTTVSASFSASFTGLSSDSLGSYGPIGTHATIGYTITPDNGTETVKWSNSSNPADAATYGTGANPTAFPGLDGLSMYLHVTDGGETRTYSFPVRYAPGTAPAVADGQTWTVDDTSVNIDASASGANLTFSYTASGLPAGVSINSGTGAITGTPTAVASGTATVTATDQYGRTYQDTFTFSASLRAQATAAGLLDLSFVESTTISATDLTTDFTTNGNTLTYAFVDTPPANLSVSSGGSLTGTTVAGAVADANYTLRATDEYGRTTDSEVAIEITAAGSAVNPSVSSDTYTAPSGGNPATFDVAGTYAGADTLILEAVFGNDPITVSDAQLTAQSGGTNTLEFFTIDPFTFGSSNDITGLTSASEAADRIAYQIREKNNGGTTGVITPADVISGLDFTDQTIGATTPADNATGIDKTANIVINFGDSAHGTMPLRLTSDNSAVETFDLDAQTSDGASTVSVSGGVVTITPSGLADSTGYYIDFANVTDEAGNPVSPTPDATTLNWTTAAAPSSSAPTIVDTITGQYVSSISKSVTIPAAATTAWVIVCFRAGNGGQNASGATINGVSMTKVSDNTRLNSRIYGSIFELASPATGAQTVQVNFNITNQNGAVAYVITAEGTVGLATYGFDARTAQGTALSVGLTTLADDYLIGVAQEGDSGIDLTTYTWTGATENATFRANTNETGCTIAEKSSGVTAGTSTITVDRAKDYLQLIAMAFR